MGLRWVLTSELTFLSFPDSFLLILPSPERTGRRCRHCLSLWSRHHSPSTRHRVLSASVAQALAAGPCFRASLSAKQGDAFTTNQGGQITHSLWLSVTFIFPRKAPLLLFQRMGLFSQISTSCLDPSPGWDLQSRRAFPCSRVTSIRQYVLWPGFSRTTSQLTVGQTAE